MLVLPPAHVAIGQWRSRASSCPRARIRSTLRRDANATALNVVVVRNSGHTKVFYMGFTTLVRRPALIWEHTQRPLCSRRALGRVGAKPSSEEEDGGVHSETALHADRR